MSAAVIVALRVRASPEHAFAVFTEEIGLWWRSHPLFALTPQGDGRLRIEPGVGGRLVSDLPGGGEFEIGRITVWRPGERLALLWRQASFPPGVETALDVRFEPLGDETRITVEHCGWDLLPRDHAARHAAALALFQHRLAETWQARLRACAARAERRA